MNKKLFCMSFALLLMALALVPAARAQIALDSNPITGGGEPPGGRYDRPDPQMNLDVEIGFRLDANEFGVNNPSYDCDYTPAGYWLMDSWNTSNAFMITLSPGGNLCIRDRADFSGYGYTIEFSGVSVGDCHLLEVTHTNNVLTATLDGSTQTVNTAFAAPVYNDAYVGGVCIARECNGYHSAYGNDSFPGEVFYFRDAAIEPLVSGITVTGSATLLTNYTGCEVPPPPPTACELDPNSGECACETDPNSVECACFETPHPACLSCQP